MSARRTALLLAAVACLAVPSAASADGDPASDVLLGTSVFYPYSPAVPGSLQSRLNAETAAAARAHFPIKVALIASPTDLGVIPGLFGKPQQYADFLDQEISFQHKQLLLVVMPDGYGVQGLPPAATRAAPGLTKPTGTQTAALAAAAVTAVGRLAAAAGHPVTGASTPAAGGTGGGSSPLPVVIVAVAAVLLAGGVLGLRRRRARASASRPRPRRGPG